MAGFDRRPCETEHMQIHGWTNQKPANPNLAVYGADEKLVQAIADSDPNLAEPLHPKLPYIKAEVVHAVREEMARTVEDVLSRRTRALLLGAKATLKIAAEVAALMAAELGRDQAWQDEQVKTYSKLADGYILKP